MRCAFGNRGCTARRYIIGVSSVLQAQSLIEAGDTILSAEEIQMLDAI